jgi:hypothetical protein
VQSVPIEETYKSVKVWEGVVHVFDLTGHPTATRAYAWSSPIEESADKRRFYAVLHLAEITLDRSRVVAVIGKLVAT